MYFVEPSRAGSSGESAGEGGSVGDATGLAVAPVGSAVGVAGSVDGAAAVGTADEDGDDSADEDAEAVASSCIAPAGPAVVDEHPASTAAAIASPTVSNLMRVPIAVPRSLTTWMPFTHQNLGRTLARQGSPELENSRTVAPRFGRAVRHPATDARREVAARTGPNREPGPYASPRCDLDTHDVLGTPSPAAGGDCRSAALRQGARGHDNGQVAAPLHGWTPRREAVDARTAPASRRHPSTRVQARAAGSRREHCLNRRPDRGTSRPWPRTHPRSGRASRRPRAGG